MAADEYKALTYVNLPFIEERFAPGQTIPHSAFERSAEEAAAVLDDRTDVDENASPIWSAEEQVAELIEWGSISEDLDAPLHPDHLPVDPNEISVAGMVSRAADMVADLEKAGLDVPAKLRDFAEMSDKQIAEADSNRRMVRSLENGNGGGEIAG